MRLISFQEINFVRELQVVLLAKLLNDILHRIRDAGAGIVTEFGKNDDPSLVVTNNSIVTTLANPFGVVYVNESVLFDFEHISMGFLSPIPLAS